MKAYQTIIDNEIAPALNEMLEIAGVDKDERDPRYRVLFDINTRASARISRDISTNLEKANPEALSQAYGEDLDAWITSIIPDNPTSGQMADISAMRSLAYRAASAITSQKLVDLAARN